MSFSDEVLMAYADGELAPAQRAEVEQAMRDDPALAAAVERHRALRADVFAAFANVLDEPVPERLQPRAAAAAHVRVDALQAAGARPLTARWSWPQLGALAATLVVGVLGGALGWQGLHGGAASAPFARQGDALVAQGAVARALSQQLASEQGAAGDVRVGISFRAKDGSYCRSFTLGRNSGLACRSGDAWRVPVMVESDAEQGGAYRQAGSALPPAVADAIDQRIAGSALDAAGERAAREQGWTHR